jgi:2-haloacid dehalogenase
MNAPVALAFDVYGTLVDPIRIWKQLEKYLAAEQALHVAEVWRRKQLDIAFRLTAMGKYRDFEWCTRRGLDYALASAGHELGDAEKDDLLAQYGDLELFDDVLPGLDRLQSAGHKMVVLSNGSPAMLDAIMTCTGLGKYFDACISVDEVQVYKPSPKVYHHAAERLSRSPQEVRLVSSNPFDDIGAESAGLKAAWVDRTEGMFEPDGTPPDIVVKTLTELADVLSGRE